MPDGSFGQTTQESENKNRSWRARLGAFFRTRQGAFTIWAVTVAVGLASIIALNFSPLVGLDYISEPFLNSIDAWLWIAAASCLFWLPILLLLLDPQDNMATGPRWQLSIVTLAALAGLALASAVFAPEFRDSFKIGPGESQWHGLAASPPLVVFFSFFGVVIIARLSNAALFARYAHQQYQARQEAVLAASVRGEEDKKDLLREMANHRKEQGNAEAIGALIGTVIVVLIATLAVFAGGLGTQTTIGRDVGLMIAVAIVSVFAIVFMLDWLSELAPVRSLGRWVNGASHYFAWLAAFYNFVDFLLVRIGAQVAGAGHTNPAARYAVLGTIHLSLAIMTWYLPDPLGLIPAFIGLTLALSVSRLWAWVEEDRNLAMITQFNPSAPRRVGFKEDYRDEAIFGFMFVLVLIPMALKQADAGGLFNLSYFESADHTDPTPWFVYFCFELAKALPVVDWADIYLEPGSIDTLSPTTPWGKHATFLARTLVDLVLVAALLQAISITLRNRQQKALYAARQISRLDEMLERVELRKAVAPPKSDWFKKGLDFRHYDPERLRELHSDTTNLRVKNFIELIFQQRGDSVGYAIAVLESLAKRRASIGELQKTFKTVKQEHQNSAKRVEVWDFEGVFDHLRSVEGLRDFKFDLIEFVYEIGAIETVGAPNELEELLRTLVFSPRRDQFKYTRVQAAKALIKIVPRLNDPVRVSELLAELKAARDDIFGAAQFVPTQLENALVTRLEEIGPPRVD